MGFDKSLALDMVPQVFASVLGTLTAISDGMTYGWTSPMIPYFLSNETHIAFTKNQADWLENINLLGSVAGLPFTILSVDLLGRKISMILAAVVDLICWVLLLLANDYQIVYVSRFFAGIAGDMCFVAAPMYIAEISDYRVRGFLSSIINIMLMLGVAIVYCLGTLAAFWVTPAVGICLTACQSIFVWFLPESPYFHVYKNQPEKARKALKWLRSNQDVDRELHEIEEEVAREKTEKGRPRDLVLIDSNRKALYIAVVLNAAEHAIGISVFLMNLQVILRKAGSEYIEASTASIIFAVVMLIGTAAASVIVDKCGRKLLLITSSIITGLVLLIMSVFFHLQHLGYDVVHTSWIPAACLMVYAVAFKLGIGVIPVVIAAEIFPTPVKALGLTAADVSYVLAGIVSIYLYQVLSDSMGVHVPLYIFSTCSFAMIAYTIIWLPETKGKTLDEIQMMLKEDKEKGVHKEIGV